MTIRDIAVAFGYEVDQASVNRAEGTIRGISNMAKKLLGSIAVYFSVKGVSELAQAAADAEALESQFTQVFGDMGEEATKSLQSVADESGAMVNRMKGSFTQLAAFTKTTGADEAEALAVAERGMIAAADSAAFYDRSLEDVTASLQSLMKGNYENDAALGFSCTEITRNAKANELYGKSFKDLSEYQKQLTLLQMVEDANKLSGAVGQAARESDTWTNQLGNLKQAVQDLKAAGGGAFLKPAISILKIFVSLVQKATEKVKALTAENGALTKAMEKVRAWVKRIQPAVERMTKAFANGFHKARDAISTVINKLGGTKNVLKILAVAAAALVTALNWGKIVSGAKSFLKVFTLIGKIFNVAGLKIMAVVAIIVLLALLVEDFINFMKGNDSVIGSVFEKMGIDAEAARQTIMNVWNKIKDFLLAVWGFIKKAAGKLFDTIKGFFERNGDSIRKNFERVWGIIKTFLSGVWTFISQLASAIFGDTEESIEGSQKSTGDNLMDVWDAILDFLSTIWDTLYEVGSAVFNAVASVIESVFDKIKKFWDTWGERIIAYFKVVWNTLGKMVNGFLKIIKGIANFISAVFKGDWKGAWEAIKETFIGVWEVIKNYITAVWEAIKLVFSMAWEGIKSIFSGVGEFFQGVWDKIVGIFVTIGTAIADAITGAVKGAINAVLGGAANIINGFIKAINAAISVINAIPGVEIGKLNEMEVPMLAEGGIATRATSAIIGEGAEPEAVMPLSKLGAMISGYVKAARESEAVKSLSSCVNALKHAAVANPGTAFSGAGGGNYNIVQNNEFNNSYYGGDREATKNVSKGMKKSATDATTQMARALAYGRG